MNCTPLWLQTLGGRIPTTARLPYVLCCQEQDDRNQTALQADSGPLQSQTLATGQAQHLSVSVSPCFPSYLFIFTFRNYISAVKYLRQQKSVCVCVCVFGENKKSMSEKGQWRSQRCQRGRQAQAKWNMGGWVRLSRWHLCSRSSTTA